MSQNCPGEALPRTYDGDRVQDFFLVAQNMLRVDFPGPPCAVQTRANCDNLQKRLPDPGKQRAKVMAPIVAAA
jgi:hypothetical protein